MINLMTMADLLVAQRDASAAVTTRAKKERITQQSDDHCHHHLRKHCGHHHHHRRTHCCHPPFANLTTTKVLPKVELFLQPCSWDLESPPPGIIIFIIIITILIFSIVITSSWTPRTPQRKYPHHLGEELNSDKFSPSHVSYLVGGLKSIHLVFVFVFVFVFLLLHTLNRDWPTEDRDWFFFPRRPKCPAFYRKVIWKSFLRFWIKLQNLFYRHRMNSVTTIVNVLTWYDLIFLMILKIRIKVKSPMRLTLPGTLTTTSGVRPYLWWEYSISWDFHWIQSFWGLMKCKKESESEN